MHASRLGGRLVTGVCLFVLLYYGLSAVLTVRSLGGLEQWTRKADFLIVLTGASVLAQGDAAHLYDEQTQAAAQAALLQQAGYRPLVLLPYNHPPFEAMLVQGLRSLGFSPAAILLLWTAMSILTIGVSLSLLSAAWPALATRRGTFWFAAASFLPVLTGLLLGQSSAFMLLGWTGCTVALKRGHDGLAGAALCLAAAKPQTVPVLLLALLLQRRWRALLTFAGIAGAATVAVMPWLGWQWPARYLAFVLHISGEPAGPAAPAIEQNLQGLVDKLLPGSMLNTSLTAALLLVALGIAVVAWRKASVLPSSLDASFDQRWTLTLILALLVDPHLLPHDLTLALVPGAILLAMAGERHDARLLTWLWLGWLLGIGAVLYRGALPPPMVVWEMITAGWLCWMLWRRASQWRAPNAMRENIADHRTAPATSPADASTAIAV